MKKLPVLLSFLLFTFSFQLAHSQQWCWGRAGYGPNKSNDRCSAAATDKYGNAYFTGQYENIMTIDSVTIKDSNNQMYLVKFDAAGKLLWLRQPVPSYSSTSYGYSVTTDGTSDIYVTGANQGTMVLGSDTLNSPYEGFLAKYDFSGNVIWLVGFNGMGQSVAVDKQYNVYVGCSGGGLYKFDPNGNVLWNITDSNGTLSIYSVTTDKAENIYMTGNFIDTTKLGNILLYAPSLESEMFLAKVDPAGNVLWVQQSLAPVDTNLINGGYGYSVITDSASNVYVTGYFTDTLSWGPYRLIADSINQLFLAKYASNGHLDWVKTASNDSAGWVGSSLSADMHNNIYLGGSGGGGLTFGGHTMPGYNSVYASSCIMKLDTSGNFLSGSILNNGSFYGGYLIGIASDPTGNFIYMGGTFLDDTVFCGPDTLVVLNGGTTPYFARWTSIGECIAQVSDGTGVASIPLPEVNVTVYPNPSSGMFTMQSSVASGHPDSYRESVEVYNMLGEKVYSQITVHSSSFIVDLSNQPNGIYLYRVMDENSSLIGEGKLVIQK